jgi:hypothetical protein
MTLEGTGGSSRKQQARLIFEKKLGNFSFKFFLIDSAILNLQEIEGGRVMVLTQDNLEIKFLDEKNIVYNSFRLEGQGASPPRIDLGNPQLIPQAPATTSESNSTPKSLNSSHSTETETSRSSTSKTSKSSKEAHSWTHQNPSNST